MYVNQVLLKWLILLKLISLSVNQTTCIQLISMCMVIVKIYKMDNTQPM